MYTEIWEAGTAGTLEHISNSKCQLTPARISRRPTHVVVTIVVMVVRGGGGSGLTRRVSVCRDARTKRGWGEVGG